MQHLYPSLITQLEELTQFDFRCINAKYAKNLAAVMQASKTPEKMSLLPSFQTLFGLQKPRIAPSLVNHICTLQIRFTPPNRRQQLREMVLRSRLVCKSQSGFPVAAERACERHEFARAEHGLMFN